MNAIEIHGLEKTLGHFHLSIPDLDIPEGYITGFIGENGAGKTTTIKLMMNGLFPESGTIRLLGQDSRCKDPSFKQDIAYVGDQSGLLPQAPLHKLVQMYRPFFPRWDQIRFDSLMDQFALDRKKEYRNLSRGQQRQFSLCLALAQHPRLLIMDEPTSNLDPVVRQDFLDLLQETLAHEGTTIFFSSHITSDLDKIADYILFIHEGQPLKELTTKDRLIDAHRIVRGDTSRLNESHRRLLTNIQDNGFGFTALTWDFPAFQALADNAFVYDLPALEDIFINYIKGAKR